ncbi:MAG: bifunctional demethylmenaquinone methyltransferase/2-methoxy-6-polyprenyl-1,4-benzoquinol methylase UbiE [Bacteroidales bacterium]|nr:bifunctional demethylmenaquinone methyltransferase/2-methoxy-6-polyprenyl-1,4-benzoquinol methylase UbiE [Bacteroidales bacterium]
MEEISLQKAAIGSLFDRIAPCYDRLNHLLTLNIDRRWRRLAARTLGKGTPKVLDVACGTADLSIALVQQGRARRVIGADLSTRMLDIGKAKVAKSRLEGQIALQEGNALELPFGDADFDAVTCAFGVRNFMLPEKGLGEMYRVLRMGGRLTILEFSYPKSRLVRLFYDGYFNNLLPRIGRRLSKDSAAYSYLPASVKQFPYGQPFVQMLNMAGFVNVRQKSLSCGICMLYTAEKKVHDSTLQRP